jgi:heme/copper-type cytochrome/quinol oxidase subunit 2
MRARYGGKQMKTLLLSIIFLIVVSLLFPVYALQGAEDPVEATLNNVDAIQAMAIANQWKWSKQDVTSYVTPWEVVFKFSNGKVKKVPLQIEKMLVAVAPYINRTHR